MPELKDELAFTLNASQRITKAAYVVVLATTAAHFNFYCRAYFIFHLASTAWLCQQSFLVISPDNSFLTGIRNWCFRIECVPTGSQGSDIP